MALVAGADSLDVSELEALQELIFSPFNCALAPIETATHINKNRSFFINIKDLLNNH
jgi:hypothetical protein